MGSNITKVYDIDGQKKEMRLYPSHTDYISTIDGVNLTQKLINDKQELKDDLDNFISSLTVSLTGEVTGKAKCSSDGEITIKTSPSKKYAQKINLTGSVTGSATADTFENGIVNIETKYDRYIPQKVTLTGNATGTASVNKDGLISVNVKVNESTKVPLPVGSIQYSLSNSAIAQLQNCFGGTWECIGYVDVAPSDSSESAFNLYLYKKTAL